MRQYNRKYKIEEFINTQVGNWTILDFSHFTTNNHSQYWKCKCSCGLERTIRAVSLVNQETSGCIACCRTKNDNSFPFKSWYISQIRFKAKERRIEFSVSNSHLFEIWNQQKGTCALSDLPIELGDRFISQQTASLDRIDSSKGYVEGNIQWLHKDINKMKLHHSQEYFIELCRKIVECQKVSEACEVDYDPEASGISVNAAA